MITDREIEIALSKKQIVIDPPPIQKAFSSTTLDLKLASKLEEWIEARGQLISPGDPGYSYASYSLASQTVDALYA